MYVCYMWKEVIDCYKQLTYLKHTKQYLNTVYYSLFIYSFGFQCSFIYEICFITDIAINWIINWHVRDAKTHRCRAFSYAQLGHFVNFRFQIAPQMRMLKYVSNILAVQLN